MLDPAGKEIALNAVAAAADAVGLHNGDPGSGADNEITGGGYSRQAPTFAAASGDSVTLSAALAFTGPASAAVEYATFWAAGTRIGVGLLVGDLAFNAEGELNLTTATRFRLLNPV